MANSNYPNGFSNGVTIRGIPVLNSYPGQIFWVDSVNGSDGNRGTFDRPFATIDFAIGQCTASRGDVIACKAGHAETLTAASAITMDVIGVAIVGMGEGSNRPALTFSTSTGASIVVSAASCSIENIVGITGINALTNPLNVQAADFYCDIEWRDPTTILEAARAILGNASADRLTAKIKYLGQTGGSSCVNAVRLVGSDGARINVDFYGKASTSIVEFLTTACTDVMVSGYMYNSGTTNGSKNVVDTVTGSTWYADIVDGAAGSRYTGGSGAALASDDISTLASNMTVPTADVTTNTLERDVIGNKTDAAVVAVGTTKTLVAYAKGAITNTVVATADATGNTAVNDVVGNKTDASIYVPGTTKSVAAYVKGHADLQERVALKAAATITNGQTLFTVAGGPIEVMGLVSICATANDATASTLQYSATPTSGSAQTISGASASLASAAAGASVTLAGTALSTAALLNANGPNLIANPGTVMVPAGTITAVVGVGSTTGTWAHYLRYKPLAVGVTVS